MPRALIEIDWEEFDKLCIIQCTQVEIAWFFDCSVDTIERACKREKEMGFAEYYKQKAGVGRISLRRKQYQLAMKGDRVMLIWLGKQYLGQTEKVVQNIPDAIEVRDISKEELIGVIREARGLEKDTGA